MKKLFTYIIVSAVALSSLAFSFQPSLVSAAGSTPGQKGYFILDFQCSGKPLSPGSNEHECRWLDFVTLINRLITLALYLSFILAVVAFMYAGFLLITAGGNSSKVSQARGIFWKVIIGMIFIFLAWAIVHFITTLAGLKTDYNLLVN